MSKCEGHGSLFSFKGVKRVRIFHSKWCKICCITQYWVRIYVLYIMSYNRHKLYKNNQKMMDCEQPLGMINFSLIVHHNMGMQRNPSIWVCFFFFYLGRPSKWVHLQTPNTHIRAFLYWSSNPPPPPGVSPISRSLVVGSIGKTGVLGRR